MKLNILVVIFAVGVFWLTQSPPVTAALDPEPPQAMVLKVKQGIFKCGYGCAHATYFNDYMGELNEVTSRLAAEVNSDTNGYYKIEKIETTPILYGDSASTRGFLVSVYYSVPKQPIE